MIKTILIGSIGAFAFLNLALSFNLLIFKVFIYFDFQPYFLVENFNSKTVLTLYSFLSFVILAIYFEISNNIKNIIIKLLVLGLSALFFYWYSDIVFYEYFNSLFTQIKENSNLILLKER